jgi:protein-disulfide isomerase
MISAVSDMANTNSNEVREVIRKGIDASKEQVLQNSIPFLKNSPKNPLTGKSTIDEDVVGFQWNTLLNAIGRLGKEEKDVTLATEALLGNIVKKDYLSKEELAQNTDRLYRINDFLHSVNNKRKELQTQSFYRFEKRKKEQDKNIIQVQDFLVYFDERTPKGVTGLVASEIVQKSHTLNGSLVLTKSGHEKYSGSFRGGNLMPLFKELEKLDMVTNIGGHDYAGGISIEGDIDTFLTSMNNLISNGDFKFQRTDMAYRLGKVKSVKDIKNAIKSLKIETKNKVVIFSDPMCPACISRVPAILQQLKNKEGLAVYYYHFPLNIHPTATIASIIMEKATADGVKDVHEKIYLGDLRNYMNVNKNTEPSIALAAVNSILKTSYKLSDIDSQDLKNRIMADVSAAVANKINGTPTIIYNGKKDNLRALQAYLKATK